jgi:hypothetical protein
MATSGTTAFELSEADAVIQAYGRCGVKRPALTPEHMVDARVNANLLLAEWENSQPHLWKVDAEPFDLPLVQGQATYILPPDTIVALDVYLTKTVNGITTDRTLFPVSRSDYATYPNKEQQAPPNVYWFNRQEVPQISFYATPDANGPYTAKLYRVTQFEDVRLRGAETADVVRRFLPAFVSGLAARLSEIYAPTLFDALEARHQSRFQAAIIQDQEDSPLTVAPALASYFR